jgi:hypothetical protein
VKEERGNPEPTSVSWSSSSVLGIQKIYVGIVKRVLLLKIVSASDRAYPAVCVQELLQLQRSKNLL